jgi:hypothetical protein
MIAVSLTPPLLFCLRCDTPGLAGFETARHIANDRL